MLVQISKGKVSFLKKELKTNTKSNLSGFQLFFDYKSEIR